jgi:hypothetical protein
MVGTHSLLDRGIAASSVGPSPAAMLPPNIANLLNAALPGISLNVVDIVARLFMGQPVYPRPDVLFRRFSFYDRQTFGTAAATSYTFFGAGNALVPAQRNRSGALANNQVFLIDGLTFKLKTGTDINGATVAGGVQAVGTPASNTPVVDRAEQIRQILESGIISMRVGPDSILEDYGLDTCSAAGGAFVNSSVSATSTAGQGVGVAQVLNGMPTPQAYRPVGPILELPSRPLLATVGFPSGLTLTSNGVIECRAHGWLVQQR